MGRRFTGSQSLYCRVLSTIVCPSSPCKLLGQVRPSGQRHCLSTQGDPYKSTLLQTSLRSEHSGNSSSLSCKIKINKHLRRCCSNACTIFFDFLTTTYSSLYLNVLYICMLALVCIVASFVDGVSLDGSSLVAFNLLTFSFYFSL